jgi:hypothetical protein
MKLPLTFTAFVLVAGASASLADDTYSLRWSPKEGDTATYTMTGDLQLNVGDATLKSKTVQKVIKVAADGSYSIQFTPQDGTVVYQGQALPMGRKISITTYKATGEVVSVTGDDTSATSVRFANLSEFRRPQDPLKIGGAWTYDIKADSKTGIVAVHTSGKLVDAEKYDNVDALKVTLSSDEGNVPNPGSIDATYFIDQKDGSLLHYDAKWTSVMFAGAATPLSGTMTMDRVAN